jgi:hypothetical protein
VHQRDEPARLPTVAGLARGSLGTGRSWVEDSRVAGAVDGCVARAACSRTHARSSSKNHASPERADRIERICVEPAGTNGARTLFSPTGRT